MKVLASVGIGSLVVAVLGLFSAWVWSPPFRDLFVSIALSAGGTFVALGTAIGWYRRTPIDARMKGVYITYASNPLKYRFTQASFLAFACALLLAGLYGFYRYAAT